MHAAWPPPVPPLLSNSAPLASQGRAQLGSRPSLGGPLSPSAQLIPPPAFGRRFIPEVSARDRYGRNILLRYVPRLICHAKCVPDADPVGGETRGNAPFGTRGSGGIPRPFEGGIGGPGGHRGEVGIPPAPLAGGAIPQRKNDLANAKTFYRLESCTWKRRKPLLQHANAPCHRISAAGGTLYRLVCSRGITPQHPPGRTAPPASARRR